MAGTRISQKPPPHIDPTQAPVAFGNRALPRLKLGLKDAQLEVRQRALSALCALIHDPQRAYETLHHDCLGILKTLLKDKDDTVRTKTTEVLYQLSIHRVGREAFLETDMVGPLSDMLDERVDECRWNVHRTLNMMAKSPAGVFRLLSLTLVPNLVEKVMVELEVIRVLVLSTLTRCTWADAVPTLLSDGVAVLRDQLTHSSPEIRRAAASAMLAISVPKRGKIKVCEESVLPILVRLLSDDDLGVKSNAAGVIMNTAVITDGKYLSLQAGALVPLLRLVESEDTAACANALRALACLAEVPDARTELLQHLPLLQTRLAHPVSIIQRAAETTIQVITWKP